jgi:hypothetical protein
VQQAPGIPCALFTPGRTILQTSGAPRREIAELHLNVADPFFKLRTIRNNSFLRVSGDSIARSALLSCMTGC